MAVAVATSPIISAQTPNDPSASVSSPNSLNSVVPQLLERVQSLQAQAAGAHITALDRENRLVSLGVEKAQVDRELTQVKNLLKQKESEVQALRARDDRASEQIGALEREVAALRVQLDQVIKLYRTALLTNERLRLLITKPQTAAPSIGLLDYVARAFDSGFRGFNPPNR